MIININIITFVDHPYLHLTVISCITFTVSVVSMKTLRYDDEAETEPRAGGLFDLQIVPPGCSVLGR